MILKKKHQSQFTEKFILFLLVAQAGFPFFLGDTWLLIVFSINLFIFIIKKYTPNAFILRFASAFVIIMILQIIFFGNFLLGPFLGILLRIFYAYVAIKIIGENIFDYFLDFMIFITKLSLVLWLVLAFVPGTYEIAKEISLKFIQPLELYSVHARNNLIVYTNGYWLQNNLPRNAGPFWEPGGFGVFLVIAILFNTMKTKKLYDKTNLLFLTGLITTFSLGAYIAFFVFIFTVLTYVNKSINKPSFLLALFLITFFYFSFEKYDFLGAKLRARENKVSVTLSDETTYANLNYTVGRNDQLRLDLKSFFASPVFGEGQFVEYKYGSSAVGITALLRKWGILGFLLIFGSMYFSMKRYVQKKNLPASYIYVTLITFIAVSASQSIWGISLFIGFSFVFLLFDNYKPENKLHKNKKYYLIKRPLAIKSITED